MKQANDSQKNIIENGQTPAAIIAGPGTGKTFTIVKKVVDLVKNKGIPTNRILITTFTKKAAAELNTRIISEFKNEGINTDLKDLKIGNFHSLASIFLDQYASPAKGFFKAEVIDNYFEEYLLASNIQRFKSIRGFNETFKWGQAKKIQQIFETVTNNLLDPEILKISDDPNDRFAYEVYSTHYNFLREKGLTNFQLLLLDFYRLLKDPIKGEEIRSNIDFVIIDEYQDTNYIQQEIAFLLTSGKDIMVFGDDDQSLYSFRGADPKNLTDFAKTCKEKLGEPANIYRLTNNYRSNQAIIDFSNAWMDIGKFKDNDEKKLTAQNPETNPNAIVKARADNFENLYKIIKILYKDINLNQIAFLFPSFANPYPLALEAYFEKRGLPVVNFSKTNFFDRYEIRLLMSVFIKIYGSYPKNLDSYPNMGFEAENKLKYNLYLASLFDDKNLGSKQLENFIRNLKNNKDLSLSEIAYKAFELVGFRQILDQKLEGLKSYRAQSNLAIFTKLIAAYENHFDKKAPGFYQEFIYGYLYYYFTNNAIKEYEDTNPKFDALNFMTIHNAKGLEYDVVFVSGLNDFPREQKEKFLQKYDRAVVDERDKESDFYRKYYTAFTRSKNLLVLLDNSRDIRLRNLIEPLPTSSDLRTIDFHRELPKKEKPILAYTTDIEVYKSCPLRYKFLRKLGFSQVKNEAAIFGSRVHQLAELLAKTDPAEIDKNVLKSFLAANPDFANPMANFLGQDFYVNATEVNYKLDRNVYILQGNIDMILADGSIVDIKTGSYNEQILEKYKNQLATYKYLMEGNGDGPEDLFLYFIENDELIKIEDPELKLAEIDEIAAGIIAENIYHKTDDIYQCKFCPMKYYCKRY